MVEVEDFESRGDGVSLKRGVKRCGFASKRGTVSTSRVKAKAVA